MDKGMSDESSEELQEYSVDGVDLTLIRSMLSLTPAERLDVLQQTVNLVESVRSILKELPATSAGLDYHGGKCLTSEDLTAYIDARLAGSGVSIRMLDPATLIAIQEDRAADIALTPIVRQVVEQKCRLAAAASQTTPSPSRPI